MNDAYAVLDLLTAYQPAALVVAAARTGIFDALGEPATAARIARRTGLVEAPLVAALDALVGLGYASAIDGSGDPDSVGAPPGPRATARRSLGRLVRSDGELATVVAKEGFFARVWTELDVTLRTGRPRVRAWADRVATEPETARSFLEALVVLARPDRAGPHAAAAARAGRRGGRRRRRAGLVRRSRSPRTAPS